MPPPQRDTFAGVYDQHRQGLFTLTLAVAQCPARAEDAVHEAFVRLWATGDERVIGDHVAYAYAAVRRAAIDQRRKAACPLPAASIHHDEGPDGRLIASEREATLRTTLATLPDDQREAIIMRIYGGLSFEALAQALAVPLQTAASRYRRGLQRLRAALQPQAEEP